MTKHVTGFDKTETFLKNQKWVDDMTADKRLELAYNRAKAFGTTGESYSNVWKSMSYLGIIKEETKNQKSTDTQQ